MIGTHEEDGNILLTLARGKGSDLYRYAANALVASEHFSSNCSSKFLGKDPASLSVLDLGSGEGALTQTLWSMGFRDITCVEVRASNIEKARFVYDVFDIDVQIIASDVESFLESNKRRYDLVVFMGLLYHLIDPVRVVGRIGKIVNYLCVCETVVAQPNMRGLDSDPDYSPTESRILRKDR